MPVAAGAWRGVWRPSASPSWPRRCRAWAQRLQALRRSVFAVLALALVVARGGGLGVGVCDSAGVGV
eukprot:5392572-Alexandrium_andersonii.AAC.1